MSVLDIPRSFKYCLNTQINRFILRLRGACYGANFRTRGRILVRGTGSIKLGDYVTINSCLESNPIGGDTKSVLFAKNDGKIVIGIRVGISNSAIVAIDNISIEDNVFIGGGCRIYDHDFHSLEYEDRVIGTDSNVLSAPVQIKEGAFIGAGSIILKGVTIGCHSVIGAGSVVAKDVPNNEIWAGNPARFIKSI